MGIILKVCSRTASHWRNVGTRSVRLAAISVISTSLLSSPASARGLNGAAVGFGLLGAVMGMAIAQQAYAHRGVRRHPFQRAYYVPRRRAALVPREVSVRPDRETTLLSFYNCNGPIAVTATASSGFIKQRHSTRFDCGNPDQPVIEFVYLGPSSGVGGDFVRYLEHGRTKAVDHIAFNLNAPIQETPQLVRITNFDERWIWRAWDCNNGPIPLSASARSGYTVIRDNVANVCGEDAHPVKEVVYRSAEGFVGSDSVTVKSNSRAPVEIPITVSSAAPIHVVVTNVGANAARPINPIYSPAPPPPNAPMAVSAEYVGPSETAVPPATAASSPDVPSSPPVSELPTKLCHLDWSNCKNNEELVKNYTLLGEAKSSCKSEAKAQSHYGRTDWPWFPFETFIRGEDYVTSGIAVLIEPDAQIQNQSGAMVHSRVRCSYDLRAKRVMGVDISER
jgi:hypothetical protein